MGGQISRLFNGHQYRNLSQTDSESGSSPIDNNKYNFYSSTTLLSFLSSRRVRFLIFSTLFVLFSLFIIHTFYPSFPTKVDWAKSIDSELLSADNKTTQENGQDWSQFAYVQYVTDVEYLCNSVMLFEILNRLGSKADRLMMYPSNYNLTSESTEARLLLKAQNEFNVKLSPIDILQRNNSDSTWDQSYTKLLAFDQTQYKRVMSLDSDSTVLQSMDELFLLPPAPIALPRAYWLNPEEHVLSSQLMLIQPSKREFSRIQRAIKTANDGEFDMEIINKLYGNSAIILPHRTYDLVTGELRSKDHSRYFGNEEEVWSAEAALKEAKFLHFSDWPIPKPWIKGDQRVVEEKQPGCVMDENIGQWNCKDREMWLGFYEDFRNRRKDVCDLDPASRKRSIDTEFEVCEPGAWEYVIRT